MGNDQPACGNQRREDTEQHLEKRFGGYPVGKGRIQGAHHGQQQALDDVHDRQVFDTKPLEEQRIGGTAAYGHTGTDNHEEEQEIQYVSCLPLMDQE